MRIQRQRALEIITLALAPAAVISVYGAFQVIILPGTHLPHLCGVWPKKIKVLLNNVSVVPGIWTPYLVVHSPEIYPPDYN